MAEAVTASTSLKPSYTSSGSMSLDASLRTGSRLRGGLNDLVIDLFRANEQSVKQAGLTWVAEKSELVSDAELDVWLRRPSGVLVVGSNKPLLSRLINGEDVKNQAAGTIRTATGNLIYLNLSQLMKMRLRYIHVDWQKSAIPELRDYGNCLEEALCEKFCSCLLEKSTVMYIRDASGVEKESFTNVERKFLGRRLFIHLGVLTHPENTSHSFQFQLQDSIWFIFCGVTVPKTVEDCRGIYFQYPSLCVSLTRPKLADGTDHSVLCFAENKDSHRGSSSAQATWHVLEAKSAAGIDELVRASLSFKSSTTTSAPKGTAKTRLSTSTATSTGGADQLPPKPRSLKATIPATSASSTPQAVEKPPTLAPSVPTSVSVTPQKDVIPENETATTPEELIEDEEADAAEEDDAEADEWWAQGPVEYDEAVPTYYDYQQETYFYYGNVLYYDPDWSSYYYYDWEQESYMYVDEDTQQAINDGTIPIWNAEDQQYYDPSQWVGEEEGEGEDMHEEETMLEQTPAQMTVEADASTSAEPQVAEASELGSAELTSDKQDAEEVAKLDSRASEALGPDAVLRTPTIEEVATPETVTTGISPLETKQAPGDASKTSTLEERAESTGAPVKEIEDGMPVAEGLVEDASSSADGDIKPYAQPSLTRTAKTAVSQPPKAPDRFSGSIEQFQSSESMLVNRAMRQLIELLEPQSHLLAEYARRPNGTLRIGRNKRLIDGLIHGTMELKSLTATDCSDVASSLTFLNLPQLIHIRQKAQNSAWDKSPQSALKTFAMKTDSLIAEKLVVFCLQRTVREGDTEAATRNEQLLKLLSALECRHVGSQLIFVVGAMAELKQSKERIMGEAYCAGVSPTARTSWWFLACSPTGGVVVPRGIITEKPKGLFLKLPAYEAQFDRPEGIDHVFKLVAGRQSGGFIQWDVLEITL